LPIDLRHCFSTRPAYSRSGGEPNFGHSDSLLFQAGFETGRAEAFICFHIVQDLLPVFQPDGRVLSILMFFAGRTYSGSKVVKPRTWFSMYDDSQLLAASTGGR
jgi:hypothetical protein